MTIMFCTLLHSALMSITCLPSAQTLEMPLEFEAKNSSKKGAMMRFEAVSTMNEKFSSQRNIVKTVVLL
jgi:hypothetical protein